MAAKSKKNQESSGHGGTRTGAGRKPRAITQFKREVIEALAGDGSLAADIKNDAAAYAFCLINSVMRSNDVGVTVRLDCATEILNRVWGKPTERREIDQTTRADAVRVFLSDDPPEAMEGPPPGP